jgi:hypothetical protein
MACKPDISVTLTAEEAVKEYHEVAALLNWNKKMIGFFCQSSLISGYFHPTFKEWVVYRQSLENLINFAKNRFEAGFAKQK